MKTSAVVTAQRGLHARPVAELCSFARNLEGKIWICAEGKDEVLATDLFGLMNLNIRQNDIVFIKTEGENDEEVALKVKDFLENVE
ncbi:MAG: HPr family phosphocarrier protein [Lachnospiraceae bacterium]